MRGSGARDGRPPLKMGALLLGAALLLAACGARVAKDGDTALVHYRGTLDSGEEFDSSRGGEPLSFLVGGGKVIPGFDKAVLGLSVGESIRVRLEPEEAYGLRSEDYVFEVPRDQAPEELAVGDLVQLSNGAPALIVAVTDDVVRIDANHPLAGQDLTFEIELVALE